MERQEKRAEWKDMLKTLAAVVPVAITLAGGPSFFRSFGRATHYGLENSLSHFSFLLGDRFVFWGTLGAFALGFVVFWVVRACLHAFCRQVQSQYDERRQWTVRLYHLFFGKKKKVVRTLLAFALSFLFSFTTYLFSFGAFSDVASLGVECEGGPPLCHAFLGCGRVLLDHLSGGGRHRQQATAHPVDSAGGGHVCRNPLQL